MITEARGSGVSGSSGLCWVATQIIIRSLNSHNKNQ